MPAFTPVHELKKYLGEGTVQFNGAHVFKLFLTNSAPTAAGTLIKGDLTPISATGGYVEKTLTLTWTETGAGTGTWRLANNADVVWSASGGNFDAFQYVVLYDDTPTSPADPILGYWDNGSAINLTSGNNFTLDLDANYTIFTL